MNLSTEKLLQIIQAIYPNWELQKTLELTGGISAQTMLLEVATPDPKLQKMVLRQHGEADRQRNPNIAQDEFKLLTVLYEISIPVPKPIQVDSSNSILPYPYLLIEFIDGHTKLEQNHSATSIQQLSVTLANIHQVDLSTHDLSFLPSRKVYLMQQLNSVSSHINDLQEILQNALPYIQYNPSVLLHGDYWLGNILWQNDDIVAVIDWEDAMLGDPLSDLGKSRIEMLWKLGQGTMDTYTNHYLHLMPGIDTTYLPFWDLVGAYRLSQFTEWFDNDKIINTMQSQYDEFVDNAIQQLKHLIR